MKLKISLLLSILLIGFGLRAASDKEGSPKITFSEKSYDFGVVKAANGAVSHSFEFTNDGDSPLLILSASASCGCTRPDYPKDPIKAGKKGKIKVTFNPKGRGGEFNKTVIVRTNAKNGKKVTLKIKGNIVPEE